MFDAKIHLVANQLNLTIVESNQVNEQQKTIVISNISNLIKISKRVIIILSIGAKFDFHKALYSPKSKYNLLNFKKIHLNDYHLETLNNDTK